MNIARAVEVIRGELAVELAAHVDAAIEANPESKELSIPSFGIHLTNGAQEYLETCRRRLIACPTEERRKCQEGKVQVLVEAIETSTDQYLWNAYSVENDEHKFYVINEKLGHYSVGPYA